MVVVVAVEVGKVGWGGVPKQNLTDKRFFWLSLYAQPGLWVALAVVAVVKMEGVGWLSLNGMCCSNSPKKISTRHFVGFYEGIVVGLSNGSFQVGGGDIRIGLRCGMSARLTISHSDCINPHPDEHDCIFKMR